MSNDSNLPLSAGNMSSIHEHPQGESCHAGMRDPRAADAVQALKDEFAARTRTAFSGDRAGAEARNDCDDFDELDELLGPDAPVSAEDRISPVSGGGAGARSPFFWKVLILAAALVWGLSTFVMKDTLNVLPTFLLLACRFVPAALIMLALFFKRICVHFNKRNIVVGVTMGVIMWLAYGLQTLGLNDTTAGKSAFLTGTYCILVPFFSYALAREELTKYNVGAALLCLGGIALVALDNLSMSLGDAQTLAGACFFALQMSIVAKYGRNLDVNVITFWMFLTVGIMSAVVSATTETMPPLSAWTPEVFGVLAFLSVICTCICLLIQNLALAHVPPATGSLLLSMESPSGVFFSVILAGEVLTGRLLMGFGLIFLSVILSETHFSFLRGLLPAQRGAEDDIVLDLADDASVALEYAEVHAKIDVA